MQQDNLDFAIVLHGGAGVIAKELSPDPFVHALSRIIKDAHAFASLNLSTDSFGPMDIVEHVVNMLENESLFNAGHGAVLNCDGKHELEASIMDGKTHRCGSAMMLTTVKNPISLSRAVMDHTPHVCLAGPGAEHLADSIPALERMENARFTVPARVLQLKLAKEMHAVANDHDLQRDIAKVDTGDDGAKGTVGCVCMFKGHVAAATSTGGMTNKYVGRIGDAALIGAGTYASDKTCAVSCTGKGEEFMRAVAAYDISARIEYGGRSLDAACRETVFEKLPMESGGVIAVNSKGEMSMPYNSLGMFRAYCDSNAPSCHVAVWEDLIDVPLKA